MHCSSNYSKSNGHANHAANAFTNTFTNTFTNRTSIPHTYICTHNPNSNT
jgi:hypothetical protein